MKTVHIYKKSEFYILGGCVICSKKGLEPKYHNLINKIIQEKFNSFIENSTVQQEDLYQAAVVSILELKNKKHKFNSQGQVYNLIKATVKGALKNYIQEESLNGMSGFPKNKYWNIVKDKLKLNKAKDIEYFNFIKDKNRLQSLDSLDTTNDIQDEEVVCLHDIVCNHTPSALNYMEKKELNSIVKLAVEKTRRAVCNNLVNMFILKYCILNTMSNIVAADYLKVTPRAVGLAKERVIKKIISFIPSIKEYCTDSAYVMDAQYRDITDVYPEIININDICHMIISVKETSDNVDGGSFNVIKYKEVK